MIDEVKRMIDGLCHCIGDSADENDQSASGDCLDCPLKHECNWTVAGAMEMCIDTLLSLSDELEQVRQERDGLNILLAQAQSMLETRTRERDVAVQDLNMSCPCEVCARSCQYDKVNPSDECADFMWRGVKED